MSRPCHEDPSSDYYSDFQLLCPIESRARKVDKMIHTALANCVARIHEIAKQHPDAGIGDTATDEAIAEQFYSKLH